MKKFYSIAVLMCFLLTNILTAAEPMAVHDPRGDWYDVKSDYYRCTFYVGCMYPVWFTSSDGKVEFPRSFMLDWIKKADAPDTELHFLRNDRYAEVKLIENSADTLVVECVGKFCKDIYQFPGVTARYRWTLRKNSPEIRLDAEVSVAPDAPRQLCLTMLGCMAFSGIPFEQVQVGKADFRPFRTAGKAPESFVSPDGVMLKTADNMLFGVSTAAGAWNNSFQRYYTYVSKHTTLEERRWNGKTPLNFSMTFKIIGSAPRTAAD